MSVKQRKIKVYLPLMRHMITKKFHRAFMYVVGSMSFIVVVDICFIFGDCYSGSISLFIILNFNNLFWNMLLLFSYKTLKTDLFTKEKIQQIEHHHKVEPQIK